MKLFDFLCAGCQDVFEEFASQVGDKAECPYCGSEASAIISGTRFRLDGTDPAFSTAWDKWAKVHEQAAKKCRDDPE